ncbi:hypothetical protein ACP3V3_16735 [Vibrio sp. PNB22_3_1]
MSLKNENSPGSGERLSLVEALSCLEDEQVKLALNRVQIIKPWSLQMESVARRIAGNPDDAHLSFRGLLSRDRWLLRPDELAEDAVLFTHVEHFLNAQEYIARLGRVDICRDIDIIFIPTLKSMRVCMSLLSEYRRIHLASDLDLNGLKFHEQLQGISGSALWLSPVDWTEFEHCFTETVESSDLMMSISLADRFGLKDEVMLLRSSGHFCRFEWDYGEVSYA